MENVKGTAIIGINAHEFAQNRSKDVIRTMINSKKHKVIINKKSLDIMSADTDFYEFMGDSRFYYTLERLLVEEDRKRLRNLIAKESRDWFVIHLMDEEGREIPCYARLQKFSVSENIEVLLLDIDRLRESEWQLDKRRKVNEAIHGLYGDDAFVYYPAQDEVEIITGMGNRMSCQKMSLDCLQKNLDMVMEDKNSINEFISGLRNGSRYLFIQADGCIWNTEKEVKHSIIKCAGLYENGEYYMAVGYVHEYMERTYTDTRKIEIDSLTGLLAKGEITNMVIKTIDLEKHQNVSLAIVDIDHFKQVNDVFGHMTGDTIIRQVATVLADEVGENGLVGRIGGDEFMILFYDAYDMESARPRLRSIKNRIFSMFPQDVPGQPAVTLSIGCAAYPKDATNYEELFTLADFALYRAKEKGRNRYIIYNRELHGDLSQIKNTTQSKTRINNRGDMSKGDILCVIMDKVACREAYPLERLLDDYLENFEIPRIAVYDREEGRALYMAGQKVPSKSVLEETQGYVLGDYWQKNYENSETVINDIVSIQQAEEETFQKMKKQGVMACLQVPFQDRKGRKCVLSFETVNKKHVWNTEQLHYYRLMAKILAEYTLN